MFKILVMTKGTSYCTYMFGGGGGGVVSNLSKYLPTSLVIRKCAIVLKKDFSTGYQTYEQIVHGKCNSYLSLKN